MSSPFAWLAAGPMLLALGCASGRTARLDPGAYPCSVILRPADRTQHLIRREEVDSALMLRFWIVSADVFEFGHSLNRSRGHYRIAGDSVHFDDAFAGRIFRDSLFVNMIVVGNPADSATRVALACARSDR